MSKLLTEPKFISKLNIMSKILISFRKLKIFSNDISQNNARGDCAVKWLCLISIKSEQVSKMYAIVNLSLHAMHICGSSPFNKKERVR